VKGGGGGRQFGKLHMRFHADPAWRALTSDAQWLYSHLLSQPMTNGAGVTPLQITKWSKGAADMTLERIQRAVEVLTEREFLIVDYDTEEVLLRSFIADDTPTAGTPHVLKGAINRSLLVQSVEIRRALVKEISNLGRELTPEQIDGLAALEDSTRSGEGLRP
jgi:hypothetical protein